MTARVKHVQRAQKPYTCGRCQKPIEKGQPYRWSKPGFRSKTKLIRCMDTVCSFRSSELATGKMSDVYAAIEGAEEDIAAAESLEDIAAGFDMAADNLQGVADEYNEASEQWAGGNGHEEWQDSANLLEEAAESLREWKDDHEENDDVEELKEMASAFLQELELP